MTDPTIAAWSRENDLLFQLRQLREENERLREDQQGVDAVAALTEDGWTWDGDQWQRPAQQEPAAWQDTANHMKIVSAEDWENIDPMWHWMYRPLYPSPSQREPLLREIAALSANALDDYKMIQKLMAERQPLTDDEIWAICQPLGFAQLSPEVVARAIEAAHGIKENT